jgi:hypothetical protein
MAAHTGGALARAVDVIPGLAILDILQVAITLHYRYHLRARVPIDAVRLVADNRNPLVYRHLQELSMLNASFHRQLLAGEIAVFLQRFPVTS